MGQVSVSFLRTCVAYHEEGSEDRQSIASSALSLFLILREARGEPAAGLDTPAVAGSCRSTLAVRAMVISDIFTQDAQFSCGKFHQLAVERVRAEFWCGAGPWVWASSSASSPGP